MIGSNTILDRLRASAAAPAVACWLAVYGILVASGQRFDATYLNYGWQLVPWDVLSKQPWSSVWYLHIQPPLWNLTLGVAAWSSPLGDSVTLQIVMASFGVIAVAAATILASRIGLSRRAAVIVALLVTLNPEFLKGVFEPTYELPVAAALLVLVSVLAGLGSAPESSSIRRRLFAVAAIATTVSMTRSLYHPAWAVTIVIIALWFVRHRITPKTVAAVLAVPVIVMGSWMVKNDVLFGQPNLSSWFGMNLQRAVIPVLDRDDLVQMRNRGEVSEIAMIGPFGKYDLYKDAVAPCAPKRTHRALSEPSRTTDEWSPNFNYECYLPIFGQAGKDAWAVIRAHPRVWVEGRLWSLRSMDSVSVAPSTSRSLVMRTLDTAYSWMRLDFGGVLSTKGWGTPIYGQLTAPVDFALVLVPLYLLAIAAGFVPLVRRVRGRPVPAMSLALVGTSFTVVFTIIVGAVAELGEQSRFRTMTDPVATVVVIGILGAIIRRRQMASEEERSWFPRRLDAVLLRRSDRRERTN